MHFYGVSCLDCESSLWPCKQVCTRPHHCVPENIVTTFLLPVCNCANTQSYWKPSPAMLHFFAPLYNKITGKLVHGDCLFFVSSGLFGSKFIGFYPWCPWPPQDEMPCTHLSMCIIPSVNSIHSDSVTWSSFLGSFAGSLRPSLHPTSMGGPYHVSP